MSLPKSATDEVSATYCGRPSQSAPDAPLTNSRTERSPAPSETTAARASVSAAAVVSEGAGERSVREFLSGVSGPDWLALPQYAALTSSVALFGYDTPPPGLEVLAGEVDEPMLLMYGEHGQPLERVLNPKYAAAAGDDAVLWEVPGSGHMGGLDAQPEQYEDRVVAFLDDALRVATARSYTG